LVVGFFVIAVIAFAATFVFLPTEQVYGTCFGGGACVNRASLSCSVFGFGGIENYFGYYSFTYHCSGFLKPMF